MEILIEYLNTMFMGLPETEEVKKAREELLQMMEDKYNELIGMGVPKNSAIGTIISEFGNVDELKESLGIKNAEAENSEAEITEKENEPVEIITEEEAAEYEKAKIKQAIRTSFGVALLILSPAVLIFFAHFLANKVLAVILMFLFIAVGVGLFIINAYKGKKWERLRNVFDECSADEIKLTRTGKIINSIFWPTITIIYFLWSFIGNAWDISWAVWTVAPFLKIILNVIFKNREEENTGVDYDK